MKYIFRGIHIFLSIIATCLYNSLATIYNIGFKDNVSLLFLSNVKSNEDIPAGLVVTTVAIYFVAIIGSIGFIVEKFQS